MILNDITIYFASNVGNSRQNQEDNAILPNGSFLDAELVKSISEHRQTHEAIYKGNFENGFLVAVSDGMGGHASGEVASSLTVRYLSQKYRQFIDGAYLNEQFIINEIGSLNRSVISYSKRDNCLRGMGATLCGVICTNGMYYGVNVGDSRLYHYYNNHLEQLSTDHTEGQRLLKLNLLTEDEYQRFPRRKNLYKYIGINSELIPDVFKIGNCIPGSTLVLCSDGLTDALSDEEIATVLSKPGSIEYRGHLLIDQALERNIGHGDNITLILIEF